MRTKIAVVEDELLIALDIKGLLEESGYEAIINITSVEDAIICIEKEKPNLVLIDINLQKNKDGVELGAYLLQKDTIPYIYLTSYCNKITLDRVNETRPYGYVVKPFKDEALMATVSVVLNKFNYQKIEAEAPENEPIPYSIREIVNYINNHLEKKIEIDELVALTKWKKHHFLRIFTKYMKITPYQYILFRKIEKAKILLICSESTISDIAFDLGFESQSNFYQAFKKIAKLTPEHYRKSKRV
jgi:AraC-like DNA-binding protein